MPIEIRDAGKAIEMIQQLRDAQEQAGDLTAAAALSESIYGLLRAAGELAKPPADDAQLEQLTRSAMVAPDLRTRAHSRYTLVVKKARLDMGGKKNPAQLAKRK